MEEEHTKEPSDNNPEEAAGYVKAVNMLLQLFVNDIRGFNRYAQQDAYKNFLQKLHLAVSGRKYDPGKKAPKKRHTSDVKTADPKPSTSQAQPQDESISEQQPQGASTTEQQPQGDASTDTQQEPVPSQFSDSDKLPDPFAITTKTFVTKDSRSIPKKPKYSL